MMRALVFTKPNLVELQDVPRPRVEAGSVLVNVRTAGICGSELHGFRHAGFRRPPMIMGHEFAGVTSEGRRVVANPLISCGTCDLCRRDLPQICRTRVLLGVQRPGGFAEQVAVPSGALHDLPDRLSFHTAAMVEPLANAVHVWNRVDLSGTERVAIVGAGTIGLVCLLVARARGLSDLTVVDRSPSRLALAARLGAAAGPSELSGEYDIVVDAVGSDVTRRASVERLRPGGTSIWIGLASALPGLDGNGLVRMEKRIIGSFAYNPAEFAEAIALAGELDLSWTTAVPLEDSQRVFMTLAGGAADPVKAVIVVGGAGY